MKLTKEMLDKASEAIDRLLRVAASVMNVELESSINGGYTLTFFIKAFSLFKLEEILKPFRGGPTSDVWVNVSADTIVIPGYVKVVFNCVPARTIAKLIEFE